MKESALNVFFLFSRCKISGSILFSPFSNLFSTQLLDKNQICYTFHEIHVTSTIIEGSPFAYAFHVNDASKQGAKTDLQ